MDLVYGAINNVINFHNVQISSILLIKNATKYILNALLMEIIVYQLLHVLILLKSPVMLE